MVACERGERASRCAATWMTVQQPWVKAVAVKTVAQQEVSTPNRMRERPVKSGTMRSNALQCAANEHAKVRPRSRNGRHQGIVMGLRPASRRGFSY